MSRSNENPNRELPELLKTLGEGGGRFLQGVYSTPWTGVPFTLFVLAELEASFPGITQKFIDNLGRFAGIIGTMIANALAPLANALKLPAGGATGPGKPDVNVPAGNGKFCIQWTPQAWVQFVNAISGFPVVGAEACFLTKEVRDSQLATLRADPTKNWYWTFTGVDK